MRSIGDVMQGYLPQESGRGIEVRDIRSRLPAPVSLTPEVATALGSELLTGDQLHAAIPYLVHGVGDLTNAYAWRRLGSLCQRLGYVDHALTCFRRSLALEPGERYGLLGLAKALCDWPQATLTERVNVACELVALLDLPQPAPVAYALANTVRGIAKCCSHPAIAQLSEDLRAFARQCDDRTDADHIRAMERRLEAVLRAADLVGDTMSHTGRLAAAEGQAALDQARVRLALMPPA